MKVCTGTFIAAAVDLLLYVHTMCLFINTMVLLIVLRATLVYARSSVGSRLSCYVTKRTPGTLFLSSLE